jgi:DNA-binding transcriptional LysR family regulator
MHIDLTTLRLFVAVIDSGTIAAASEREHIAPSAVSKRLSDLEEALRTPLLQRSNRGIEPTSAGTALVSMARSVLNDLDNIPLQLSDYTWGARGLVRIFANISAITEFLPGSLRSFMARYPDVQIQLAEKISSSVVRGVASNAADVGLFARGDSEVEGLVTLPYRRDELVVAVPADHPLASCDSVPISTTLEYDYVGLHTGSFINQELLKAARLLGLPFRCRMQVTSFDALTLMVEAGMGIALMPRLIGERFSKLSGIRILTLNESWAFRDLCICVRSLDSLPSAARLFVTHLQDEGI